MPVSKITPNVAFLGEESSINPLVKEQQQLGSIAGLKPYDIEKGLILELKTLHNHL